MQVKLFGTEPGQRLDLFLSSKLEVSRSQIQRLIDRGHILVDGKRVKKNYLLLGGEKIDVELPKTQVLEPEEMELDLVYEDEHLAVINKPAGLVVHPGSGNLHGTLVSGLLAQGWPLSDLSGDDRPGLVHRLDKDSSGLLIIAKDNETHRFLQRELEERRLIRIYWALVEGVPKWEEYNLEGYMERNPRKPTSYRLADRGRFSRTHFKLLEVYRGFSLIEASLDTGRTHQIRVHLKSLHLPIVGDREYGSKSSKNRAPRQLLHARYLEFNHPRGGHLSLEADLPGDFLDFIGKVK